MTGVAKHAGLTKELNLLTILMALTPYDTDKIINDLERPYHCIEATIHDQLFKSKEECREYLLKHTKCTDNLQDVIEYCWYPHLETVEEKYMACLDQCRALIDGFRGLRAVDDRDHYRNKRIDTSGALLASLFYQLFDNFKESLQKKQHKCMLTKTKTFQSNVLCRRASSPTGSSALATGNWRVKGTLPRDAKAFPNCSTETLTSLASPNFDESIPVLAHPKK